MAMRIRQSARVRSGGRVRIRSNMANQRVSLCVPRGTSVRIRTPKV